MVKATFLLSDGEDFEVTDERQLRDGETPFVGIVKLRKNDMGPGTIITANLLQHPPPTTEAENG